MVLHLQQSRHLCVQRLLALLLHRQFFRARYRRARTVDRTLQRTIVKTKPLFHQRFELLKVELMGVGYAVQSTEQFLQQLGGGRIPLEVGRESEIVFRLK